MKDPAFLFYDGDAARDVSHMNRLERGAYFDLIQAQRKFGGYTVEQIRKILGKDFDEVWPALELILSKDKDNIYFIEWVKNSIDKRKEHAEIQRKRIQNYWDNKRKENEEKQIPINNDGNTVVLPLVNENEIVNEIENINYNEIVNKYNSICKSLPKIEKLTESRKKKIKIRFFEIGGYEGFEKLFNLVESTPFLKGDNKQQWKADFNWLIENDTNYVKVLEGKYGKSEIIQQSRNFYNDMLKPEYR